MSEIRKSELVFLYDISWANPNGDPNDGNKPRIDSETGLNFVTDVRLKRTVRDELFEKGYEVLVRDTFTESGDLADAKHRAMDFYNEDMKKKYKGKKGKGSMLPEELEVFKGNVKECIDIRLFGCVLPNDLKNASITYTGPVQFKMGYSMHPVKLELVKGTGAFSSGEGKDQKTFRQEYLLPYSLINFYGLINSRAARETGLSETDIDLLLSAMWEGTKNLISRSKAGQMPRFLLRVAYKTKDFYIGGIDKMIRFRYEGSGEAVRSLEDGVLSLDKLIQVLEENKEHIDEVYYKADPLLKTDLDLEKELKDRSIKVSEISM